MSKTPFDDIHWKDVQILKRAFDCSPDLILIIDPQLMKFVDGNQTALNALGYTKEELLKLGPADIDAAFNAEAIAAAFDTILNSKEQHATFPTINKRKDKSTFEVEVYLRSFIENGRPYILASATDTSVLKKAQEKLIFHSTLLRNISDAIVSTDENFVITSWNAHAHEIFGWSANEVMGKSAKTFIADFYPPERIKKVEDIIFKEGSWKGELKHYHKDKTEVWTLVSASVLKDEKDTPKGFVLVAKDISEQKKLEVQLRKLNEQLEKKVQEKTAEVKEILERVSDTVVALDNNDRYTYVNNKGNILLQRPPGYLIGKHLWTEFPDSVGQPFEKAYRQAVTTREHQYSIAYDNGLNLWIENHFYPSATGISIYGRDVTERKKAELALEESELRYRTLVETANEGIWQIDENNITTYANNYLATLLGYTKEEMIGREALDFISDANKQKVLGNLEERKKGISSQHELTFVDRKQQTIITLIQSTPLCKQGKYAGSISMLLDITKRKQAEEQLAANERRFRALIENSSDGIALLSPAGIFLYNSPSGEKITGYRSDEIIGTDRLNYIHPEDREQVKNSLKNLLEEPVEVKKIELRYRVKNGDYKWLDCSYSNLLDDPSVNAIIINYRDITEQKNAEKQLQKNEEQLSLIYNSSIVGMWLINVEDGNRFRFETVNHAYINITGKTKEEVVGRLLEEVVPAKSIVDVKAKYIQAVQTAQVVSFFNTAIFKVAEITAEIKIIPIKNEAGKVVQLLGTANDVTEQKKARKELLQMNVQLRDLASHLQTIREDERTSMAREIHDELGQQLTVLKMDLSWLNKKIIPRDENIESKLKSSLQLIDSTIDTVRKIAAELRPSILDDLGLAEAIEWQSVEFTNRTGIVVNYRYSGKPGKFPEDISIGLFRIFQESLTNIARHANATVIDCFLQNTGNILNLTITDDGVGFNLDAKVERKTLGLLGMRERVMMLNGKFNVTSQPGKGTTVSVEVPLLLTSVSTE